MRANPLFSPFPLVLTGAFWLGCAEPAPVDYRAVEATLAPGVELEALPWSSRLPADGADDFDVSPDGHLVVLIDGELFDADTGDRLTQGGTPVASFGFAAGALAVATADGRMGYVEGDGIRLVAEPRFGPAGVRSTSENAELLLVRTEEPYDLAALRPGEPLEPVGTAPSRIVAADAGGGRRVFATETELWSVEPGAALPILRLPESSPPILGVAVRGGTVYFSTAQGVYAVAEVVALPVALDVGGPLRGTPEGLVVLNRASGRLYRLSGAGLRPELTPQPGAAAGIEPDPAQAAPYLLGTRPFVCLPEHPDFVRSHPLDDRSYPECYEPSRQVRVAAFLQRTEGIPYLILHGAWTLEQHADPIQVQASDLSLRYLSPDGTESELEPVRDLTGAPNLAVLFAMQHELVSTALESGEGHAGTLYFYPPDDPTAEGGMYIADLMVRGTVIHFEFPATELALPEERQ